MLLMAGGREQCLSFFMEEAVSAAGSAKGYAYIVERHFQIVLFICRSFSLYARFIQHQHTQTHFFLSPIPQYQVLCDALSVALAKMSRSMANGV